MLPGRQPVTKVTQCLISERQLIYEVTHMVNEHKLLVLLWERQICLFSFQRIIKLPIQRSFVSLYLLRIYEINLKINEYKSQANE